MTSFFKKILSLLVILSMKQTMVAKMISELKSICRTRNWQQST